MSKSHFLPSQGGAISGLLSGRHVEDHFVHFVGLLGCHLGSISGVNFGTIFRTLPTGTLARGGGGAGGGHGFETEWGSTAGDTKYKGIQY